MWTEPDSLGLLYRVNPTNITCGGFHLCLYNLTYSMISPYSRQTLHRNWPCISTKKNKKKNRVRKSVPQHQSTWLREWETWAMWMNVFRLNEDEVSQMQCVHYEPDRVNESTRLLPTWQRVGMSVQQHLTWGYTIWFEPPITQMSSCHSCLNYLKNTLLVFSQ